MQHPFLKIILHINIPGTFEQHCIPNYTYSLRCRQSYLYLVYFFSTVPVYIILQVILVDADGREEFKVETQ
jgi:hypothetical protein